MANRDAILSFLDTYLESESFEDALPIGLQVEGATKVHKVATAVSASEAIFQKAAEWRADMVLVHHGMFWKGEDPRVIGHRRRRLLLLLQNNINLVAYHLPLDAHAQVGNNILFAEGMGFEDTQPFGNYHGRPIGFKGHIGPLPIESFQEKASHFYGRAPLAFLEGPATISTVGIVSGNAWSLIDQAAQQGLDCFVTGIADEPVYHLAREHGIHFLAYGHHATERIGIQKLGEVIRRKFEVEVQFFDVENPL